jgi:D-methionine transport system permease protein
MRRPGTSARLVADRNPSARSSALTDAASGSRGHHQRLTFRPISHPHRASAPLTHLLVGTSIGTWAAVVPLVIGGIPYAARLSEAALLDVDPGLIQAVVAMGASIRELLLKVYLPEALPSLLRAFTVPAITMINFSAMAGAVGGGGLGDLAIRYGYQRFRIDVLIGTVLILILLVQSIQIAGNALARRVDRR